jgi:hypothetical protein
MVTFGLKLAQVRPASTVVATMPLGRAVANLFGAPAISSVRRHPPLGSAWADGQEAASTCVIMVVNQFFEASASRSTPSISPSTS